MKKTVLILLLSLSLTLIMAQLVNPSASFAIGKVTPTPQVDEALDVDAALEELLALLQDNDYQQGIELAGEILQEDEQSWKAYYYRAIAHRRQEDWHDAIADYDAALAIRPYDAQIWRLRGETQLSNSDPRQALADYQQSLKWNPRSTQTYSSLIRLHERDRDKSLRDLYQSIVEAAGVHAQGSSNRAITILDEAIGRFDRGSRPMQLAYAYFNRAHIWTSKESWQSALGDINAAMDLQPDMQEYHLARGFIYSRLEQLALAAPDFYQRMLLIERESIDEQLALNDSVTIEMDHGVVARLLFQGEAGQKVSISARDHLGSGVDPLLVLLDAQGLPVLGNDDGGGQKDALIADYELPEDGVYTLMVSHANGGYEGKIRVSLR